MGGLVPLASGGSYAPYTHPYCKTCASDFWAVLCIPPFPKSSMEHLLKVIPNALLRIQEISIKGLAEGHVPLQQADLPSVPAK